MKMRWQWMYNDRHSPKFIFGVHNSTCVQLDGFMWCPCGAHYYRMLLMWHYDQRPFDETVCDALIANDDVKKCQKRCKTFAMNDTSNMVQILVPCAMRGRRLIYTNCLRWDRTTETCSQMKVCAIYGIQFTPMNRLRWLRWTQTIQRNKMCVIPDKQVGNQYCVRSL